MAILDRHVVARFLWNFVLLFGAIFAFGVAVDVMLNTPRFLEAADALVREEVTGSRWIAFPLVLLDFHGPRVFQFFQFMVGMVSVGAMGFTFAQMHRARELVAIMAAGIRLRRTAAAVLWAAAALSPAAAVLSPGVRKASTLPSSSAMTRSAMRLPISGSVASSLASFSAMARAMTPGLCTSARRALRLPMPLTVVKSSKNSRCDSFSKPMRRGMNDEPWFWPSKYCSVWSVMV